MYRHRPSFHAGDAYIFAVACLIVALIVMLIADCTGSERHVWETTILAQEHTPAWTETRQVFHHSTKDFPAHWTTETYHHPHKYHLLTSDGFTLEVNAADFHRYSTGTRVVLSSRIGRFSGFNYPPTIMGPVPPLEPIP